MKELMRNVYLKDGTLFTKAGTAVTTARKFLRALESGFLGEASWRR